MSANDVLSSFNHPLQNPPVLGPVNKYLAWEFFFPHNSAVSMLGVVQHEHEGAGDTALGALVFSTRVKEVQQSVRTVWGLFVRKSSSALRNSGIQFQIVVLKTKKSAKSSNHFHVGDCVAC